MKACKRPGLMVALLCSPFLFASCATMVNSTTQRVNISSDPPGAQVAVDNMPAGVTPTTIELKRKSQHTVKIEKAGYLPQEETILQSTSGWLAGDIIAGGLIGLGVDAASGGMYNLTPDSISATLVKAGPASPEAESPAPPVGAVPAGPQTPVAAEGTTHP